MGISLKTIKIIWGRAAGRCSYPGCSLDLVMPGSSGDPDSVVGEIAHLVARRGGGPRGDSAISERKLDDPSNLLLLCRLHHKLVDDQPKTHTVEVLGGFKRDHECWVRDNLCRASVHEVDAQSRPPVAPAGSMGDAASAEPNGLEEELVRLRRRVVADPADAVAWQSFAWVQYRLGRYPEAFECLERAHAAGAGVEHLEQIRAAILTEDGARRGEKAGLLQALDIFTRLAEGSSEWVHHYNLGNVLKALNDDQQAAQAYDEAIRLDDGRPEVWINLATVQHRLGRHAEELDSFDRALELSPEKPEALAGKGATLVVDHQDGPGGAKLLQRALDVAPERWSDWPHIWYWLAEAHRIAGDTGRALKVVDEGVRRAPSDRYLLNLKATLLAQLWRDNDSYVAEARSFYRRMVELSPYDYGRRGELLALRMHEGDEAGAWALLEETFPLMGVEVGGVHLRDLGTLHASYHALRFVPDYAAYRLGNPVESYWDATDPLVKELDSAPLPQRSPPAEHLLTAAGAIAFGACFEVLDGTVAADRDEGALLASYRQAVDVLLRASPAFTIAILENEYAEGKRAHVLPIPELLTFVGDVLLREVSRLSGWIAERFGVSEILRTKVVETDEVTRFYEAVLEIALQTTLLVGALESE